MYILYAPHEKFGVLPPKVSLVSPELFFYHNIAYCPKRYWRDQALLQGIRDITPKDIKKLRSKRQLNFILINSRGGIGDCLWMVPLVRALRKKYPRADIRVVTDPNRVALWLGSKWVNAVLSPPPDQMPHMFYACDEIFDAGGVATYYKGHKDKHPVNILFERMEIDLPRDKHELRPDITLSAEEAKRAETFLVDNKLNPRTDKFVVIGLESSTPNRNWPLRYSMDLTSKFLEKGYKVVWMGQNKDFKNTTAFTCSCNYYIELSTLQHPGPLNFNCPVCKKQNTIGIKKVPDGVVNLVAETDLRMAMSIIAMCDLFVGPDSGLLNIAGALTVPSVGLFGPILARLRNAYFVRHYSLQGNAPCAPCFEHWTECREGYPSPCMRDISPDKVYQAAKEVLKKWPRESRNKMPLE